MELDSKVLNRLENRFQTLFQGAGFVGSGGFIKERSAQVVEQRYIRAFADLTDPSGLALKGSTVRQFFLLRWRYRRARQVLTGLVEERKLHPPEGVAAESPFAALPGLTGAIQQSPWGSAGLATRTWREVVKQARQRIPKGSKKTRLVPRVLKEFAEPARPARWARLVLLAPVGDWAPAPAKEEPSTTRQEEVKEEKKGGAMGLITDAAGFLGKALGGLTASKAEDPDQVEIDEQRKDLEETIAERRQAEAACSGGDFSACAALPGLLARETTLRVGLSDEDLAAAEKAAGEFVGKAAAAAGEAAQDVAAAADQVADAAANQGGGAAGSAAAAGQDVAIAGADAHSRWAAAKQKVKGFFGGGDDDCGLVCTASRTVVGVVGLQIVGGVVGALLLTRLIRVIGASPATPVLIRQAGATGQKSLEMTGLLAQKALDKASISGLMQ